MAEITSRLTECPLGLTQAGQGLGRAVHWAHLNKKKNGRTTLDSPCGKNR